MYKRQAENILSDTRLDFVIGSMHELPGHDDFAFLDYSHENIPNLLEEYFNEIYKMCKWGKFDVLGHLTYALRYIQGEQNIKVDMKPYEEIIRQILKTIIQNGCGIEINTSGLYQKYGKTFPDFKYIKLYRARRILSTISLHKFLFLDFARFVLYNKERE